MFISLFAMDLFCPGYFKFTILINRPQDYTVATELSFLK